MGSWAGLALVSDAEIGQLEPEAVAAAAPWGATAWSSARTEAKRDLKIWLEMDFPTIPGVADRVLDRWPPDYVFAYTGGAYTDRTTEMTDDEEEDLDLAAVFATFADDRLYVGAAFEFEGLLMKLLDSVNAAAATLTVKYWGGNQWQSITPTDNTAAAGATLAKSGRITWTIPTDWERRTLNGTGDEYYWVELSVSAALTAGTSASQILPIRAPDALKRIAAYLALHHIYNGLAAQAANPEDWRARGDKYFDDAKQLYGQVKASSALWLDANRDQVIEPAAGETTIGRPVTLGRA